MAGNILVVKRKVIKIEISGFILFVNGKDSTEK